jgi:hypothetical protein
VTQDSSLNLWIYINGVKITSYDAHVQGTGSLNDAGNNMYIGNNVNGDRAFDGKIEEVVVWDRVLSEEEVRNLYRKGVSRLDLNVYSCSDAACNTKTSSVLIEDTNNNAWLDINALSNSQYLGFDTLFTVVTDFSDYNAGTHWVGSYLQDVNIFYESGAPPVVVYTIDLNVMDSNTLVDLNFVSMDCNVDAYDLTDQNSPFTQDFNAGTYSCDFSVSGYDTNTGFSIIADANNDYDIYLTLTPPPATLDVNFIYPDTNGSTIVITQWYFKLTSNGSAVTDANYYLNDGVAQDLESYCTDWNTTTVTCNLTGVGLIPFSWNDLNVNMDTNSDGQHNEMITNYYDPTDTGGPPFIISIEEIFAFVLLIITFIVLLLIVINRGN